jgi:hypothetical protein
MSLPSLDNDFRPRFSGEITPAQAQTLSQILPHGMKKHLVQVFVNGVIDLHARGGQTALGAIVSEFISINQLLLIGLRVSRERKIKELEKKLEELRNVQSNNS